jgi:hypothetical protein
LAVNVNVAEDDVEVPPFAGPDVIDATGAYRRRLWW